MWYAKPQQYVQCVGIVFIAEEYISEDELEICALKILTSIEDAE